jgi:hypothetical protein
MGILMYVHTRMPGEWIQMANRSGCHLNIHMNDSSSSQYLWNIRNGRFGFQITHGQYLAEVVHNVPLFLHTEANLG